MDRWVYHLLEIRQFVAIDRSGSPLDSLSFFHFLKLFLFIFWGSGVGAEEKGWHFPFYRFLFKGLLLVENTFGFLISDIIFDLPGTWAD